MILSLPRTLVELFLGQFGVFLCHLVDYMLRHNLCVHALFEAVFVGCRDYRVAL